jgi:hypothetical protein
VSYIIVSGYSSGGLHDTEGKRSLWSPDLFLAKWTKNTYLHAHPLNTYVISSDSPPPENGLLIVRVADLGHVQNMPSEQRLSGWSAALLTGCLLAYQSNADLIFKEQDCLAFGPWVDRLYNEIGTAPFITGKTNSGGQANGLLAQSLMLVQNSALLPFVSTYLSITTSDRDLWPEHKVKLIGAKLGIAHTSMGYDRSRPINYADKAFYAQQWSDAELNELDNRKMV